jgi:hypothetical protein
MAAEFCLGSISFILEGLYQLNYTVLKRWRTQSPCPCRKMNLVRPVRNQTPDRVMLAHHLVAYCIGEMM